MFNDKLISTKDVDVVTTADVVDVLTTCKILPLSVGVAKVLSPLKKVVASLVPDAVSLASETELSAKLDVVTLPAPSDDIIVLPPVSCIVSTFKIAVIMLLSCMHRNMIYIVMHY